MANILSPAIANFVAGNSILNDVKYGALYKVVGDNMSITSANQALNNVIALGVIDSGAILDKLIFYNDTALDTNGSPTLTVDIGLYTMDVAGNLTAVSAACYSSASTAIRAANATGVDLMTANGAAVTSATVLTTAASIAGVSPDPVKQYVIGLKIHAAAATAAATVPCAWKIVTIKN